MKFYTSHQIALHSAIIEHGFDKSDYSFTKRKGRIIANHNSSAATFSFIERRESTLDPVKMRVMDKFTYDISINGKDPLEARSWDELAVEFDHWLKEVKSNK